MSAAVKHWCLVQLRANMFGYTPYRIVLFSESASDPHFLSHLNSVSTFLCSTEYSSPLFSLIINHSTFLISPGFLSPLSAYSALAETVETVGSFCYQSSSLIYIHHHRLVRRAYRHDRSKVSLIFRDLCVVNNHCTNGLCFVCRSDNLGTYIVSVSIMIDAGNRDSCKY